MKKSPFTYSIRMNNKSPWEGNQGRKWGHLSPVPCLPFQERLVRDETISCCAFGRNTTLVVYHVVPFLCQLWITKSPWAGLLADTTSGRKHENLQKQKIARVFILLRLLAFVQHGILLVDNAPGSCPIVIIPHESTPPEKAVSHALFHLVDVLRLLELLDTRIFVLSY